MKLYGTALGVLLLLAGCGEPAPSVTEPPKSIADAPPEIPVMSREVRILAIGDSLLTGYGLADGQGYPEQLEAALRARGVNARIANAGVSGDTSAAGQQRLSFALNNQSAVPDLVIISLGGNDMLRGLPPQQTRANLDAMLAEIGKRDIDALLLGMLAVPNLGRDYAAAFNPIYPSLAKQHGAALVPFFLEPLMDRPDLIQDDKIHPTELGVEAMVVSTVERVAAVVTQDM